MGEHIRVRSTAGSVEGVLELKVGDKSSYNGEKLKRVIHDQLVRKYLAPETRRTGFLVISRSTRQSWTAPEAGDALDFPGLINMLREEARRVSASVPGELHIEVVGLDLAPRLVTEREEQRAAQASRPPSEKKPGRAATGTTRARNPKARKSF